MSMPDSMPLQTGEGISSSAAPETQPRAPRSRALLGRAILGICFFGIYLLLTRSDIILQARSGFSVWYPANGLAFAFMLGISPWYAPLAAVADFLSAHIFGIVNRVAPTLRDEMIEIQAADAPALSGVNRP